MKTKIGIGMAIAALMVAAALAVPVAADYSGDHSLTIYEHDTINGGLIYVTDETGTYYTRLYSDPDPAYGMPGSMAQEIAIEIPEGATVKMARLYNTYCWSTSNSHDPYAPGVPAQAELTFSDGINTRTKTCDHGYPDSAINLIPNPIYYGDDAVQYWDTKGQNYTTKIWDYPSGEFAWDVTGMVIGSGTYTATIENIDWETPTDGEYFCTFGFGLLVMYEKPSSPRIEYWIAEGCDSLMARAFETPESATTSATFGGVSSAISADLTTVLTCSDGGLLTPPRNMIYFNDEEIGPSTAEGICHYGVNYFDVTSLLSPDENVVEFQDRNDCEYVHNAFLVVENPVIPAIPAGVTFDKKKLDLSSSGILKAFITLPEPYDVADINISTVECEGAPVVGSKISGKDVLEAKFGIQDLEGVEPRPEVKLTVKGELFDGTTFEGSNTVEVV